jgi:hypothetical protein
MRASFGCRRRDPGRGSRIGAAVAGEIHTKAERRFYPKFFNRLEVILGILLNPNFPKQQTRSSKAKQRSSLVFSRTHNSKTTLHLFIAAFIFFITRVVSLLFLLSSSLFLISICFSLLFSFYF